MQKNWAPFYENNKLYFIKLINPHIVYEYDLKNEKVVDVFKSEWTPKWINNEIFLKGNTPPIKLPNGDYLSTFHTTENVLINGLNNRFYDNGFYTFESKPPFNVKEISNISFLYGEMASRKFYNYLDKPFLKNIMHFCCHCTFPLGMIKEDDKIIISYGDSDSLIKYCEIPIESILKTLRPI
jgi:hypothetical protein